MGGKSRKSGGVSKRLINQIKSGNVKKGKSKDTKSLKTFWDEEKGN